jgi:hypothetical protein
MNRRLFNSAIVIAACAAASSSAFAQPVKPPIDVGIQDHITITCKDPNNPSVLRQADGGYVEIGQGWFYKADLKQGTGWAGAYCYYGMDKVAPSKRPSYSVHYQLTGFKSNQCKVSGKTITCGREPVIKP